MNRRDVLQAGGGVLAASALPGVTSGGQATQSESLAPLASLDISGATDCTVQEGFAYIAADDGFAIVDISEPSAPDIAAERRDIDTGTDRPFLDLLDCWVWEDRFVIGGPGNPNESATNGFALYDVSEPTAPEQLAFYETGQSFSGGYFIHNLYVEEGIVYLTGSGAPADPLVMVDITGTEPEEVGRWSLESYDSGYADVPAPSRSLHDVTVQNGIAYIPCWDAGTWLVDVTDPTAPRTLAQITEYDLADLRDLSTTEAFRESFTPPGNAHYTMVNDEGTLLGVGQEGWAYQNSGGPGGIDLYDVSTKTEPDHLARIDAPPSDDQTRGGAFTSAHNFDFAGDRLYSSWYYGGVTVHDIKDPSAPEEIAHWRDSTQASFWTAEAAEDVFVATSADVSKILRENPPPVREALYVFPDPGTELSESGDSMGGTPEDASADGEDPGGENAESNSTDDETNGDAAGPGFGIPAAVGGVLGGYYLSRRRDSD